MINYEFQFYQYKICLYFENLTKASGSAKSGAKLGTEYQLNNYIKLLNKDGVGGS